MQIIPINDDTLNAGYAALQDYQLQAICGPTIRYSDGTPSRRGGIASIPGAIDALIEQGVHDLEAIVYVASRVSGCRRSTVRRLIDATAGASASTCLWARWSDELYHHDDAGVGAPPRFLIAA